MKNRLGVVITGGECPPKRITQQAMQGKNTLIVAADSGLFHAEEAELKPDYIIGDMDSIEVMRLTAYPAEFVIRHDRDKDYTDTELAFKLAVDKGCDEIWIIGGGGGRIDHLFGIRSLFEREIFPCRWITDNADIWCIEASDKTSTEAFWAGNTLSMKSGNDNLVSVFPLGGGPWEAISEGLKWPLKSLSWDRGFFGLSNVAVDGEFLIKTEKGRFMVILPLLI
ncbi:MAG: thiamine diphosphokinase [Treponema sp.]|jgi:thiamine pyrophosphokinase|nr:thiamine diphosphokinase [Treponema sp.]